MQAPGSALACPLYNDSWGKQEILSLFYTGPSAIFDLFSSFKEEKSNSMGLKGTTVPVKHTIYL